MPLLSKNEEIILATVWKLKENAYGVTINDAIRKNTGLNWKFGSIYTPLSRLVKKGLLDTVTGAPTAERGGRRKTYFQLTKRGEAALLEAQKLNTAIWNNLPSIDAHKS